MRTILALALAANIVFSAGANYLQGALVSQAGAASSSMVSNAAGPTAEQAPEI
jgi:hypothetical protein